MTPLFAGSVAYAVIFYGIPLFFLGGEIVHGQVNGSDVHVPEGETAERVTGETPRIANDLLDEHMEVKTRLLLDIQYSIRMTGMWSNEHIETPNSSQKIQLLKMVIGSAQTQTLLQLLMEKRHGDEDTTSMLSMDETADINASAKYLELSFPMDDEELLAQTLGARDDMGVDISALEVVEKAFFEFPSFYFNPRIHCFSPFQNETIVCTTRPVEF
ncbi:hypothetical protein XU18_2821 [Perkinsela sp. CCAP 1560/4]|nr:hypothetical protein XU18_2821 [Perkinsela sp. CCAP 1560/4]|eukprot:KNH06316.1 hypothetical protein XU18_2821 [Perkinsela sp. CCAP 1560/4]